MELYPWQTDFLECKEPVSFWICPRQSGKSSASLLKSGQVSSCIIVAPYRSIVQLLTRAMAHLQEQGFNCHAEIISSSDHIEQWPELLIIDEATILSVEELRFYYEAAIQNSTQLIFIGTPRGDRALPNLCIAEKIPVHRTRQAHWHSQNDYLERLRRTMTDIQWMHEGLGMYEPDVERMFTNPSLKEYDFCELISLPPSH